MYQDRGWAPNACHQRAAKAQAEPAGQVVGSKGVAQPQVLIDPAGRVRACSCGVSGPVVCPVYQYIHRARGRRKSMVTFLFFRFRVWRVDGLPGGLALARTVPVSSLPLLLGGWAGGSVPCGLTRHAGCPFFKCSLLACEPPAHPSMHFRIHVQ